MSPNIARPLTLRTSPSDYATFNQMITLFGCAHFFNFVSFLLYPMVAKRLRCAMLRAFTVCVCTDACVCVFTDRHICVQIIIQIVNNEPIGISHSYFNQKENTKFKRCSTLEIHRLLVALRHIIRRYSVRISKLCMGGSFYGIFVFLREFTSHMLYIPITFCTKQIQESCYGIRFQVVVFLIYLA